MHREITSTNEKAAAFYNYTKKKIKYNYLDIIITYIIKKILY